MAYVSELVNKAADVFGVPRPSADVYKRELFTAGLLSQGARGRNAPHATPRDAAVVTIALIASHRPVQAPSAVDDFGSLLSRTVHQAEHPLWQWMKMPERHTFLDACTRVFECLVDPEFSEIALAHLYGKIHPRVEITIHDTRLSASIHLEDAHAVYVYPSIVDAQGKLYDGTTPGYAEYRHACSKYASGVRSQKTVDAPALIEIANCIAGKSIFELPKFRESSEDELEER